MKTKIIFACALFLFISGCTAKTPLIKASQEGDTFTTKKLITEGANINEKDSEGYTPLMYAAYYGQTETAKILLDKGADVNATNNENNVALYYAAFYDDSEIVNSMIKLLIDNGADSSIIIRSLEDEKKAYYALEALSKIGKYDKSVIPYIKKIILTQKKDIQSAAARAIDSIGIDTHEVRISDKHQIEIRLRPIVNLIFNIRANEVLEYQYPPYGFLPIYFSIRNKSNEIISIDSSNITVLDLNNKPLIISNVTDLVSKTYRADTGKQTGLGVASLLGLPIITLPVWAVTEAVWLNRRNEAHEQYYNKNMFRKKTLGKNESIEGIVIYQLNDGCENASLENYKVIMLFKNGRDENIFTLTTGLFGDIIDPNSVQAVMRKLDKTETPNIVPRDSITNRDDKQEEIESKLKANPKFSHIKGIILMNGKEIKGQILHMSAYAVIIRREEDGSVSSYLFEKEVKGFIKEK